MPDAATKLLDELSAEKDKVARARLLVDTALRSRELADAKLLAALQKHEKGRDKTLALAAGMAVLIVRPKSVSAKRVAELEAQALGLNKGWPVDGFPVDPHPNGAVLKVAAGAIVRRGDAKLLLQILDAVRGWESLVLAALAEQWPEARTPKEPISHADLSASARTLFGPMVDVLERTLRRPTFEHLARFGMRTGSHWKRLFGLEDGPAEATTKAGVPLWLVAFRVTHGSASKSTWTDALVGRTPQEIVAIVDDLANYGLWDTWPPTNPSVVGPRFYAAHRPYFALVRETCASLPSEALAAALDVKPSSRVAIGHRAAMLAELNARMISKEQLLPDAHDALLCEMLKRDIVDVESGREVLATLPINRAAALVGPLEASFYLDPREGGIALGLWRFAVCSRRPRSGSGYSTPVKSDREPSSRRAGVSAMRVTQILALLKLPAELKERIRGLQPGTPERPVTERSLRAIAKLERSVQVQTVNRRSVA